MHRGSGRRHDFGTAVHPGVCQPGEFECDYFRAFSVLHAAAELEYLRNALVFMGERSP